MCGIVGYFAKQEEDVGNLILNSLKKLEYRGYDSWGICLDGTKLIKNVGKVDEIQNSEFNGNIALGHCRWGTHGAVTKENAHPHSDCTDNIFVVHNGIIENYQELKKWLKEKGHSFKSETDSEVIPHLIEEYSKYLDYNEAVIKALKELQGSYALVILNKDFNKLIGAKKDSPLVVGISDKGYFLASDVPAFLDHTKKVIYLHDNDVVFLDNFEIINLKEGKVERKIDTIEWSIQQAKKGNYDHFMLKEIMEQKDTVEKAGEQDKQKVQDIVNKLKNKKIHLIACGSSYHACLAAKQLFSNIANIKVEVEIASEFGYQLKFLDKNSAIVAISQSGETADVLDVVKKSKEKGVYILGIVNVLGSSLTRYANDFLSINAGPEICVLSTKTYTSQIALLTLLAYAFKDKYQIGKNELDLAKTYVEKLTAKYDNIRKLAELIQDRPNIFTIGRGINVSTAMEAALKIKEVSYIHAEGFAGGELKHGTIALIDKGTPCIVFVSGENEKEILSNAMEIKSRGGYIIGISSKNNEIFDFFIEIPEAENLNPLLQIIPIQILSYYLAVLKNYDPDRPRNLAKSVTVK